MLDRYVAWSARVCVCLCAVRGVLVYWHGNGEVASDYDPFASIYHLLGLHLIVVDYRGYGWSTDTPTR